MSDTHSPRLAHHFDSHVQQFESGKLGMWIFLATEILLFGGLFCAYAVYRANHPEIFVYAHRYLDTTLGGINTAIPYTVDENGAFTEQAPGFTGKRVITDKGEKGDANEAVIKALAAAGNIIARGRLKHQ